MKRDYIYLGGLIIILLCWFVSCHVQKRLHATELRQQAQNAASLFQDSLKKVTSKHDTIYQVKFTELSPEAIKNSDLFQELTYQQQMTLVELAHYKNLLASVQANFTGEKHDTITQYIRIPVLHPFFLSWLDTTGGFTYTDTVYVDSNQVRRSFIPKLRFEPDVRILDNGKKGISGEIRVHGLEEFSLTGQNVYSFYSQNSPADIRKRKWKKVGIWTGIVASNALSFYAGTKFH